MLLRPHRIIRLFLLGLLLHGCAAAPPVKVPPEETVLPDLCRRYNVEWQWDSVSQIVTLSRQGHVAKAMVGSDLVLIGDEKVTLSAALRRHRGAVIVPADF